MENDLIFKLINVYFSMLKESNHLCSDVDVYSAYKKHVNGLLEQKKYREALDLIFEYIECFDQQYVDDFSQHIMQLVKN